jgi:nucleotidyltransferase AbiEii toxin of type IV toxin-antitoxin system
MTHKTYRSAADFRRALENRLQDIARKEAVDLQRIRRQVAFDRLLSRLFAGAQPGKFPWALKGGYAMELRMRSARATKDIDLTLRVAESGEGANHALLQRLQETTAVDAGDFFVYTVGEPIADLDAAPYGGARFPVEARVDGRAFVKFHLDVGIGDAVMEPLEVTQGRNWLQFAGIPGPSIYMIPREQQFAEKLHAYTLPRPGAVNSRVRDIVDMVLLIQSNTLARDKTSDALRITFARRQTHALPDALPTPPLDWQRPFAALARECGLPGSLEDAFSIVKAYCGELQSHGMSKKKDVPVRQDS